MATISAPNAQDVEERQTFDTLNFRILTPVCLTVFAGMLRFVAFAPFLPQIADEISSSVAVVAQVTTGTLLMAAVTGLFSGPLADYYGQRRVMTAGLAIVTLSTLMIAIAPNYELLLIGGILAGFGGSMTHPVAFAVSASRFRGEAQRQALSFTQAMATSANIIGIPVLTGVAYFALWRGAFAFLTVLLAIALVLVYRLLPGDPAAPAQRINISAILQAYKPIVSDRPTLKLLISTAIRGFGFAAPVMFSAAYFQEELGFSLQEVGFAMMISGGGIFLGTTATGSFLSNIGLRPLFFFSTIAMGFCWSAIYVAPVGAYATITLLAGSGICAGIGFTSQLALLAEGSPAGAATTMSVYMSIFTATMAVATAAGGLALSVAGYETLGIIFPIFLVFSAFLVWQPILKPRPAVSRV